MADEIWLLRHAETEWSRTGKHTGRTDVPLTDKGREVAHSLRARLEGHAFALVLCSPLARARETAQLAGLEPSALDDDLLEWDYGEYEGLTTPEIRGAATRLVPLARRRSGRREPRRRRRALRPRRRQAARDRGRRRGRRPRAHPARARLALGREPVALGGHLHLGTGSVSVLAYEREVPVISRWNF